LLAVSYTPTAFDYHAVVTWSGGGHSGTVTLTDTVHQQIIG
jgi:hypothetical protein